MLADTLEGGVKPPQTKARPALPRSRGLVERLTGWMVRAAIDGRDEQRARANAPFEPRSVRGLVALALVPGLVLIVGAMALFWRPLPGDAETLSAIPIDVPGQTPVERNLIRNIGVLRDGIWEAKLPPWSQVPFKGMARVSNPQVHAALATLLGQIADFGGTIGDRAQPGIRRDRVFLSQLADLRSRLSVIDGELGATRAITAYHLGLLALWAGDAADAEPQFDSVLATARKTEALDDEGRMRLGGIEAGAAYGLGLAEAARGQWKDAIDDFDAALTAACRTASIGQPGNHGDLGLVLGDTQLVALDTRSIRNDRLIALLRARNAGVALTARTNPTCAQLLAPAHAAPASDADDEARALSSSLSVTGDLTLAANLQLRAALMGDKGLVQQLSFDGADAELAQAQSVARAIVGLDPMADGIDKSALADLQKLSVLKSRLAQQLHNGALSEPESDPAWSWSDPALFTHWRSAMATSVAAELLARAQDVERDNPGLAASLYDVALDNSSWLPAMSVSDAWWRLNTGTTLSFVLGVLTAAAGITLVLLLILLRLRETYRSTFESYHHDDRLRAPEG